MTMIPTTTTSTSLPSSSRPPAVGPGLAWAVPAGPWLCRVRSTSIVDGDFAVGDPAPDVESRRRAIVDAPWTVLRQVHGCDVVEVQAPGQHRHAVADGALTRQASSPIAVTTADCAPVVLVTSTGVAVIHAGWRGALAGIVDAAARALCSDGSEPVIAMLGPCISARHYEFGADDLAALTAAFGSSVAVRRGDGWALDLPAVIQQACVRNGFAPPRRPECTSDPSFFSHRMRGDRGRQTTVAWLEPR